MGGHGSYVHGIMEGKTVDGNLTLKDPFDMEDLSPLNKQNGVGAGLTPTVALTFRLDS